MDRLIAEVKSWFSLLPRFTVLNLLEVLIIAFVLYEILLLIKNSHAFSLLKGLLVVLAFTMISAFLHLDNILWIMQNILTVAVTALVIIFQPELRKGLETLGRQAFFKRIVDFDRDDKSVMTDQTITEISRGVFEMAKKKTGALIVIQRDEDLSDYVNTGILIDGIVTSALLINIFEKNTPLHDGAVIIRGNCVTAATCYLPLSDNDSISKDLGTRHRAALGMSEATDSVTVVVSEETGRVSLACDGMLTRITNLEHFASELIRLVEGEKTDGRKGAGEVKDDAKA